MNKQQVDKLVIAMVASPWMPVPAFGYGGSEAVEAALIDELVEMGHEVHLIGVGETRTRAIMHRTYPEPQGERITYAVPEMVHVSMANALIQQIKPDIVHDHSLGGPLTAAGRPWVPTCATVHGEVTGERGWFYRDLNSSVSLIAISDSQRNSNPGLHWVDTIHNALKIADWPYSDTKGDRVLFVGRAHPGKGMAEAIDAAMLAGYDIDLAAKCHEPVERDYFEREIEPRLCKYGERVQWLQEVQAETRTELMLNSRCLIMPGKPWWREPFGMVAIEAMVCGTPVVTMNNGALPEIVRHGVTGIVCTDELELAGAIDRIGMIDPLACRRHVEAHFSSEVMAQYYVGVYRKVIAAYRAKPDLVEELRVARARIAELEMLRDRAWVLAEQQAQKEITPTITSLREQLRTANQKVRNYQHAEAYGDVGSIRRSATQSN